MTNESSKVSKVKEVLDSMGIEAVCSYVLERFTKEGKENEDFNGIIITHNKTDIKIGQVASMDSMIDMMARVCTKFSGKYKVPAIVPLLHAICRLGLVFDYEQEDINRLLGETLEMVKDQEADRKDDFQNLYFYGNKDGNLSQDAIFSALAKMLSGDDEDAEDHD